MLLLWGVAALLQADPLPGLLRELEAGALEVRERAGDALSELGPGFLPALGQAREQAADPEVRERLKAIVRRIETSERIRAFGGGPVLGGLSARLTAAWDFDQGLAVATLEIMNVGSHPLEVPRAEGWDLKGPAGSQSSSGNRAGLEFDGAANGHFGGRRRSMCSCGHRVEPRRSLGPGESVRLTTTLAAHQPLVGLQPGRRTLKARYRIGGAEDVLHCPEVVLEVPE